MRDSAFNLSIGTYSESLELSCFGVSTKGAASEEGLGLLLILKLLLVKPWKVKVISF
jgi:hypothetical protein